MRYVVREDNKRIEKENVELQNQAENNEPERKEQIEEEGRILQ